MRQGNGLVGEGYVVGARHADDHGHPLQAIVCNCYSVLMTLEDIQQTIAKLSPEDRTKLRLWLAQFEAGQLDREPETKASKLGRLAGRAVADFRKRMREP